jgi:hypothetical protein
MELTSETPPPRQVDSAKASVDKESSPEEESSPKESSHESFGEDSVYRTEVRASSPSESTDQRPKMSSPSEESSHLEESSHIQKSSHIEESSNIEESSHHTEKSSHHIEESSHTEEPSQKPDDGESSPEGGESSPEGGESSPDEECSQLGGLLTDLRLRSLYSECESGYDESPSECDLHEDEEDDEQERGRARGRRRAREDMEPFTDEGRVSVESGGGEEDSLASTEDLPSSQQTLLDRWDRREIIV